MKVILRFFKCMESMARDMHHPYIPSTTVLGDSKRRGQRSWFESHTPRGFAGEVALSSGERPWTTGRLCPRGKLHADLCQS